MMIGQILDITENRRYASLNRGFIKIEETGKGGKQLGQVPIDDVIAVVGNSHGLVYSNNLLVALAERGTPFVLCGSNHLPVGMLLPCAGNFEQAHRIESQIQATQPTHKRCWQQVVSSKLAQQAATLERVGGSSALLWRLSKSVKSGDPTNLEAQGARYYWTQLFDSQFRRDRAADGVNSLLNYGYTVLRAATARAVIAAGLHPSIGIHHSNDANPLRLVDDLMEPFRPAIDLCVWQLAQQEETEVTPDVKAALVKVLSTDLRSKDGTTPLSVCIQRLATSLAQVYTGAATQLYLPVSPKSNQKVFT
jgi:CRISP-associated protein Cas1